MNRLTPLFVLAVLSMLLTPAITTIQTNEEPRPETRAGKFFVGHDQLYKTIQDAVNAASPGDTIYVHNGTYSETVTVEKQITIKGNSSKSTIVDAGGNGNGFTIKKSPCSIETLKVINSGDSLFHTGILADDEMVTIKSCNISGFNAGIKVSTSHDMAVIQKNSIFDCSLGISINGADECNIQDNTIWNSQTSIFISASEGNTIKGNQMTGAGFMFSGGSVTQWTSHTIDISNKVNGRSVRYFKNLITTPFQFPSPGQLILANCKSNSFANLDITDTNYGVIAGYCDKINLVKILSNHNDRGGFYVFDCTNMNFRDCTASYNADGGFQVLSSENNVFDNVTCSNNDDFGIMFNNQNHNNKVENSNIQHNKDGIVITSSSDNNTISDSTICHNTVGVAIGDFALVCQDNKVIRNQFWNHSGSAVEIKVSSRYSQVYYNNFLSRSENELQITTPTKITDNGEETRWNNTDCGNYWHSFTKPDDRAPWGIVDTPHSVSKDDPGTDHLPLTDPYGSIGIHYDGTSEAVEDKMYKGNFTVWDFDTPENQIIWDDDTNADWLGWAGRTNVQGTPENEDVGEYYLYLHVNDGEHSASTTINITVENSNDPPNITSQPPETAAEDVEYNHEFTAVDIDPTNDTLQWFLDTNAEFLDIDLDNGVLSGIPENKDVGSYWVNISVKDDHLASDSLNYTLTVVNTNDPLFWEVVPDNITIEYEETYSFDSNASDIDLGDEISYSIISDPATNISVNETGVITWFGPETGNYTVTLKATDQTIEIEHIFRINVRQKDAPAEENLPPETELVSPGDGISIEILNPTLQWTGSDPNYDVLTFDVYFYEAEDVVQSLKDDAKIADGVWLPQFTLSSPLEKGKTYYWTVIPHDEEFTGICVSGVWSFSIEQTAIMNQPPVWLSVPPEEAGVGVEWKYQPIATDNDPGDNISITLEISPHGMTFIDGFLSWTPTDEQTGRSEVELLATDGKDSIFQTFFVTVTMEGPSNRAPEIRRLNDVTANAGETVIVRINATDPDGDPLSFSITSGPANGTISTDGLYSWVTNKNDGGTYSVIISVGDGELSATTFFRIVVIGETSVGDDDDDDTTTTPWALYLVVGLIILILLIVIIVLIISRRKPKEKEEEVLEPEVAAPLVTSGKATTLKKPKTKPVTRPPDTREMTTRPVESLPPGGEMPDMAAPDEPGSEMDESFANLQEEWELEQDILRASQEMQGTLALPPAQIFEPTAEGLPQIDEMFLMTKEGILLKHFSNKQTTIIDKDILSSMLMVVQTFVSDSMGQGKVLEELKFKDFNIMLVDGESIIVVVISSDEDVQEIKTQVNRMIKEIEEMNAETLPNWDGNYASLVGIDATLDKLLSGGY